MGIKICGRHFLILNFANIHVTLIIVNIYIYIYIYYSHYDWNL